MLINKNVGNDSIFRSEIVSRLGMDSTGVFQICGTAPEVQNAWDPEEKRFTDVVMGYGLWVRQDYKQFKQNPIFVVIPHISQKKAASFQFGENVQFDELGGYYSRKNRIYRWQARNINKVEKIKGSEK